MIENVTLRDKNVFFLHLYNITRDDDLVYECWLYSEHSPDQPIDKKTAVISGEVVLQTLVKIPYKFEIVIIAEIKFPPCKNGKEQYLYN